MTHDGEDDIRVAFDKAEDVRNPLDNLVEMAQQDPAAPFDTGVVEAMAELKTTDPQAFERLRHDLKIAGVRVTELDKAVRHVIGFDGGPQGDGKPESQADQLIAIAETAELFHAPDDTAYAAIDINGHQEVLELRSRTFKQWLAHEYYQNIGGAAGTEAYSAALNVIEAQSRFEGGEVAVHLRTAGAGSHHQIDLADADWRAVDIGPEGWQIVDRPQVNMSDRC